VTGPARTGGPVVAIVHPLKAGGASAATEQLGRWAAHAGLAAPRVVETTASSPGTEQARAAVAEGAALVLAWGGDGTATAVATGLVGTGVPLGLLPAGTGNLLARNVGVPLALESAAEAAFTGRDRLIDTVEIGLGGRVVTSTVMAGIGLDAVLIDAPDQLKSLLGPGAYVLNTAKALQHSQYRVGVSVDDGPPRWVSARSVLVVNAGGLVGGLDLAPESEVSDGLLHVIVLPLRDPVDWARTAVRLVRRRPRSDAARHHQEGHRARIVTREPQPRQVDGDVVEDGTRLEARVVPASLVVRVPDRS
jgi:diacylglycerol kinase (ATP)